MRRASSASAGVGTVAPEIVVTSNRVVGIGANMRCGVAGIRGADIAIIAISVA